MNYLRVCAVDRTAATPWRPEEGKEGNSVDYIHGEDVVLSLSKEPGRLGFLLPVLSKNDLFRTVILDGALPRKTFSMGEADEKRFYLECRRIVPG